MIHGYRVLWASNGRPKAEDFFVRSVALRRARQIVAVPNRGVRFQRRKFNGEWVDIRPSEWD